jgi:hypothetical protein
MLQQAKQVHAKELSSEFQKFSILTKIQIEHPRIFCQNLSHLAFLQKFKK